MYTIIMHYTIPYVHNNRYSKHRCAQLLCIVPYHMCTIIDIASIDLLNYYALYHTICAQTVIDIASIDVHNLYALYHAICAQ